MSSQPRSQTAAQGRPAFLNDEQIAEMLGVSVSFLRKDRRTHRRVPFIPLGGRVVYDPERVRQALLALEQGGQAKRARRERAAA